MAPSPTNPIRIDPVPSLRQLLPQPIAFSGQKTIVQASQPGQSFSQ
jgi:hypothetical protein